MNRKSCVFSFTPGGRGLAERVKDILESQGESVLQIHKPFPLKECVGRWFQEADVLIFVGAAGIAVRAIAPWVENKTRDPAVIVMDERGKHVISLLSGHLGGANALSIELAEKLLAEPVITTSSDVNGRLAVDVFAQKNGLRIDSMEDAKACAASLVAGKPVQLFCEGTVIGTPPPEICLHREMPKENGDLEGEWSIYISPRLPVVHKKRLWLIPKAYVLGIGCRRGKTLEEIKKRVQEELNRMGISIYSIRECATIDLKKQEKGLLEFCGKYGIELTCYSAEELLKAPGAYEASAFVKSVAGVDNVCGRAAVLSAGGRERLELEKTKGAGITLALGRLDWSVEFE